MRLVPGRVCGAVVGENAALEKYRRPALPEFGAGGDEILGHSTGNKQYERERETELDGQEEHDREPAEQPQGMGDVEGDGQGLQHGDQQ